MMYKKKSKRGKFKIKTNLQTEIPDETERMSSVAKKELQMMSFDFEDFSIDNKIAKIKKNDKKKSQEGIRTTANSVAKESIPSHKESISQYRNTKSKYLTSGVQRGQKFTSCKREPQKSNRNMLSINCVDFDTVRIKTRSEASMKLQEIIRQKKKRMLYSKNHKFGMNSCRSNLSTLTQYEDNPVQITEREEQRESGTFFTFNDAFDLIKRTRKQKILTEGNESKVGIRETVLRPQLFRIIAKIKNKQERKKIKQNSSQIYRKPK